MIHQQSRLLFINLSLLMLLWEGSVSSACAADKYALLIGITRYSHSRMNDTPLLYPEADATAVGQVLQKNGYTITTLLGEDATRDSIQKELNKLASQGSDGGVCLVGLFGHGVQYGNDAYFAAWDTGIRHVTDSQGNKLRNADGSVKLEPDPSTMTSMRDILDALATAGVSNRILLADCCREDPSAARGRAFGSKLSVADLPPGMAALFACSASERAWEHKYWGHGAFTYSLLQRLQTPTPGMTANELGVGLFQDVRQAVSEKTNGTERQTVNPITNGIVDLQLKAVDTTPDTLTNLTGMRLRLIPAGTFQMGSRKTAAQLAAEFSMYGAEEKFLSDEQPQHRVTLSKAFYMGIHEVTRGQFDQFVRDSGYRTEAERDGKGGYGYSTQDGYQQDVKYNWRNPGFEQTDAHPVVNVSWNDSVAFCEWPSEKTGRTYRLPTEAEWEYACRGGTTTEYAFGDDPEQLNRFGNVFDKLFKTSLNTASDSYLRSVDGFVFTAPVGQYRENGFGLYDMHGNVWEWCSDGARDYGRASVTDPIGPSGSSRVLRGGSWLYSPSNARSAFRFNFTPDVRSHFVYGFRVVCDCLRFVFPVIQRFGLWRSDSLNSDTLISDPLNRDDKVIARSFFREYLIPPHRRCNVLRCEPCLQKIRPPKRSVGIRPAPAEPDRLHLRVQDVR